MRLRELRAEALSTDEWNYIFGLFLADGSASISRSKNGGRRYRVSFSLQGNERGIVERVVQMLRRAGMNPCVMLPAGKDEIVVEMVSKALFGFLPRKSDLKWSTEARERFFNENCLYDLHSGIPFLAGLLDGDGTLKVYVEKNRSSGVGFLGDVAQWTWSFTQRRYPFLAHYVKRFVNSLSGGGTQIYKCRNRTLLVPIRKQGAQALLDARITNYCWKVGKWLEMVAEVRGKRGEFYTTKRVAKVFGVSIPTVLSWIKSGAMSSERGAKRASWHYIRAEEVERFRREFSEREKMADRIKDEGGMTTREAAHVLGVRAGTVRSWCYLGRIKAKMVREPRGQEWRHLLIGIEEVENVKRELQSECAEAMKALSMGMKIVDAAKVLHVHPRTLRRWHQKRKVSAITARDSRGRSHKFSVIPLHEVERLKKERHIE